MDATAQINEIKTQLEALKLLLGVTIEEWVTPNDATKLVGVSRSVLTKMISSAETARVTNQSYRLRYGKHYRQIPGSTHWQINWQALKQLINETPPEQWEEID